MSEIDTIVEHNGIELGERFINLITKRGIGRETDLITSFYDNRRTCVDIHTLTSRHTNNLESAKTLNLYKFLRCKPFIDDIKKGRNELLCIGLIKTVLIRKRRRKFFIA